MFPVDLYTHRTFLVVALILTTSFRFLTTLFPSPAIFPVSCTFYGHRCNSDNFSGKLSGDFSDDHSLDLARSPQTDLHGAAHGIENRASTYLHMHHLFQPNSFTHRRVTAHSAPFLVAISGECIVYLMHLCPWSFNSIKLILGETPFCPVWFCFVLF